LLISISPNFNQMPAPSAGAPSTSTSEAKVRASELFEAGIRRQKGALFSLQPHMHRPIVVECAGGVLLRGTLKGFDSNVNLTLADTLEMRAVHCPDPFAADLAPGHPSVLRFLGAAAVRGGSVVAVFAADGAQVVANPYE
jgi:small nuclear ribonucleoprotein (snRNP)-like protein